MFRANSNVHEATRVSKRRHKFHLQRFNRDRGIKYYKDFDDNIFYKCRAISTHGVSRFDSGAHYLESVVDEICKKVKGHYPS